MQINNFIHFFTRINKFFHKNFDTPNTYHTFVVDKFGYLNEFFNPSSAIA
jgi:hypothetical protein